MIIRPFKASGTNAADISTIVLARKLIDAKILGTDVLNITEKKCKTHDPAIKRLSIISSRWIKTASWPTIVITATVLKI